MRLIVGAIVVVVLALVLYVNTSHMPGAMPAPGSVNLPAAPAAAAPVPSGIAATVSPSYAAMLTKYHDRRIQFDDACAARPTTVTYKNGTSIMLDNRAAVTRVISFDAKQYNVPPLGYVVVALSSARLPHTYRVDCDAHANVLTVMLQK